MDFWKSIVRADELDTYVSRSLSKISSMYVVPLGSWMEGLVFENLMHTVKRFVTYSIT